MKKILSILLITVFLTGCSIEKIEKEEYVQAEDFSTDYSIREDHIFVDVTIEEVIDIFEEGTGIVYFGFPECPFCQEIVPILDGITVDNDIERIYYYNPRQIREDNPEEYQKLLELTKDYLEYTDDDGELMLYVPDVYFVKDGEILGNHISTSKYHDDLVHEQEEWIELTTNEKAEIKNIYLGLLTQLYSCGWDCN